MALKVLFSILNCGKQTEGVAIYLDFIIFSKYNSFYQPLSRYRLHDGYHSIDGGNLKIRQSLIFPVHTRSVSVLSASVSCRKETHIFKFLLCASNVNDVGEK